MKIEEFKIVFIGGIHGVGKTVFSNRATELLKIPCLSASKLITEQRNAPAAIKKRVQSVEENQAALVAAIESHTLMGNKFMLDGHFCVFDTSDIIKKVPLETFRALRPIAVIVLIDDVVIIQQRLQNRDGRNYGYELLNRLQETELEHATAVCNDLKISVCQVRPAEHEKALQFATRYFNYV